MPKQKASKRRAEAAELTERARERAREVAHEARERAHDVKERAHEAAERAQEAREQAMLRVGDWVTSKPMAEQFGITKRRRWPLLLGVALGALGGVAIGMVTASRRSGAERPNWSAPENLAPPLGRGQVDLDGPRGLEEAVRTRLAEDARTSSLSDLVVNIAENKAFVRGTVPPETDERVIRDVVRTVDGVEYVDLQLTVRA